MKTRNDVFPENGDDDLCRSMLFLRNGNDSKTGKEKSRRFGTNNLKCGLGKGYFCEKRTSFVRDSCKTEKRTKKERVSCETRAKTQKWTENGDKKHRTNIVFYTKRAFLTFSATKLKNKNEKEICFGTPRAQQQSTRYRRARYSSKNTKKMTVGSEKC